MRRVLFALLLVVSLASCDFQEKRALADRIREAPDRLVDAGPATIKVTLGYRVVSSSARAAGIPGGSNKTPTFTLPGELDYARHRSSGTVQLGAAPEPVLLWDGPVVYQKQVQTGTQQVRRPWRRLDVASLYDDRHRAERSAIGANLLGPAAVVDLVRGVLTGSVRKERREDVNGVSTTRYRVNIDIQKAFDDAPTELREGFEAARVLTGMSRIVHPGRVWLDDDGLPRRIEVRLRQERSRRDQIEVKLVLDLVAVGTPATISLPDAGEVSDVDSINGLGQASSDVFGGAQGGGR